MSDLKRIILFIASPGDVEPARNRVRHAIDRINRLLAKESGFLFDPIGWEDIPPGKADRAQEVINQYVDMAHIFVGILHQRFGHPTGLAESGTEEEFIRIEKRWQGENPKPTVWMYFKKVPDDRLGDPGPQLKKVLEFKDRIRSTDFYREFEDESVFEEDVENAVADWVHRNRDIAFPTKLGLPDQLEIEDVSILAVLAKIGPASDSDIAGALSRSENEVRDSLERLTLQNLVQNDVDSNTHKLASAADAFVSIAKHLLIDAYYKSFLASPYFASMLEGRLPGILANRQHCMMKEDELTVLRAYLKTSPSVGKFILFGDTTRFDNLADQVRQQKMNDQLQAMAKEIASQTVLQQAMRFWLDDAMEGKILTHLDGKLLTGQVIRVGVAASFEDRLAFQQEVVIPMVAARAAGGLKAGQMVSGPPDLFVVHGTAFCHMGEDELALQAFDRALSLQITPDLRAAALNNKGLALLRLRRFPEAISCLEEALKLNPDLKQATQNLQRATQMQDGKTKISSEGES